MSESYTGGCKCGAVRYEVSGEPAAMLYCQCRQCQRDSGTGHGALLTFVGASVTLIGQANHWTVTGDMGTRKSRGFCSGCGAPVYLSFPDNPDVFIASATSLDDPSRFKPEFVAWTDAGQAWDHLDPALQRFGKMPPS